MSAQHAPLQHLRTINSDIVPSEQWSLPTCNAREEDFIAAHNYEGFKVDAQFSSKAKLYFRTRRATENIENIPLLNELHCQGLRKSTRPITGLGAGKSLQQSNASLSCYSLYQTVPERPQHCTAPSDSPGQRSPPDLRSLALFLPDSLDSATRVQHIICSVLHSQGQR